jgi:hypothetical protein
VHKYLIFVYHLLLVILAGGTHAPRGSILRFLILGVDVIKLYRDTVCSKHAVLHNVVEKQNYSISFLYIFAEHITPHSLSYEGYGDKNVMHG